MAATGEKEREEERKREEESEEKKESGEKRKREEESEEKKESGEKRKREEESEEKKESGEKRKREEESEEKKESGEKRKREEESEEKKASRDKRKREEESEEKKESGEKREEESEEKKASGEKRKREEESEEKKESREKREEESEEKESGEKRKREEESEEVKRRGEKRKREEESEEEIGEERKKEKENEEVEKRRRGEDAEPIPGTSQAPGTSRCYPKFNIKHLTVHQVLGRGSFGVVSLASVPGRNNYVAIKGITKTADNAATLQRERRILLLARDCPFLCHLYAAHQSQDQVFFITEYLSGGSLEALLRMCSCLNTDTVSFYTAEIACGLQYLHRQNVIHRDIKPDNIMLDRDGHIRIIDLGVAQDGVTSSSKTKGVTGTIPYMAPEVLQKKTYFAAVDWWSLGIVVSRMSAGQSPFYFGCDREMARNSTTRETPDIPSWLPADLKDLIKQLLRKNPKKRLGVKRNIRDHPFFTTINWEELEQRRAQPPYTPFKTALKKEDLPWPEVETALHPLEGFSFIAPSWEW